MAKLHRPVAHILWGLVLFAGITSVSLHAQEVREGDVTASDGVRIHYFDLGPQNSRTPVILIHGFSANSEWKWIKPGIAQALATDRRVIAIDMRAHGKSEKPRDPAMLLPSRFALDIVEVMSALGIERAHVHGYSMGGVILTYLLMAHSTRIASAIYGGSGVREIDPERIAQVPEEPRVPESVAATLPSEAWNTYPGFDREPLEVFWNVVRPQVYGETSQIDLTRLSQPVLAIVGEYDLPIQKTQRMSRELSNFELLVLPGDTHGSAHFNPRYTEALVEFISSQD